MNVGFIVTSYWAFGELLIALQFAKRLKKSGFKPYFFIPTTHEKILKESDLPYSLLFPKLGRVNRVLFQDYQNNYNPEFIILADFINYYFCERHYGLTVDDLKIFKGRIGTFDDFDWGLIKRRMDTYGFSASTVSEVDINDFGFKLAPCPIANPLLNVEAEEGKFYYPLMDKLLDYNDIVKKKTRKELQLPIDRPIIMLTSAVWQETYKLYPHVKSFVSVANNTFKNILKRVSKDSIILYVGPATFLGDTKVPDNVKMLNQLPPKLFEKYAVASDLFLSRNITSTTLAKISLSGIPSIMIKNSLGFTAETKDSFKTPFKLSEQVKNELQNLDICYPYRMFPVGWHTFLEPVIKNNPYTQVVPEIELFDENQCVEKIRSVLECSVTKKKIESNVSRYKKLLDDLKTPSQILQSLR